MDRNRLLQQKVQEIESEVRRWADETLRLTAGEQMHCEIKLSIGKIPQCVVTAKSSKRREPVRCHKLGSDLSEVNWQQIERVAWTKGQRKIIDSLRVNNNRLCPSSRLANDQLRPLFKASMVEAINRVFRDSDLGYRIYAIEKLARRPWYGVDIAIFRVEILSQD